MADTCELQNVLLKMQYSYHGNNNEHLCSDRHVVPNPSPLPITVHYKMEGNDSLK